MATNFWQMSVRRIEKKYKVVYKFGPSRVAMFFLGLAMMSWISFLLTSGFPLAQYVYYRVSPRTSSQLAQIISETETRPGSSVQAGGVTELQIPPADPNLPDGHYLRIPSIGVDSVIWEAPTADYEKALRRGVWRMPESAEPQSGQPVILAAHRFGYLDWTNQYRKQNSFFNLPKLVPGDEVEIIWDKRPYRYRITHISEGEEIDSYDSELILFTCKFLKSPIKYFVYAKRV